MQRSILVMFLMTMLAGCGDDPATGSGAAQQWSDSSTIQDEAGAVSSISVLTMALIDPPSQSKTGGLTVPVVSVYINTSVTTSTIIATTVIGTDGTEQTIPFTTAPTIPGWATIVVPLSAVTNGTTGSHTYTFNLVNGDGDISNKVTTTHTITD